MEKTLKLTQSLYFNVRNAMAPLAKDHAFNASTVEIASNLSSFMGYKGCFPSQPTLADKSFCSSRTVVRHIKKLENSGIINVTRKKGLVNIYSLFDGEKFVDKIDKKMDKYLVPMVAPVVEKPRAPHWRPKFVLPSNFRLLLAAFVPDSGLCQFAVSYGLSPDAVASSFRLKYAPKDARGLDLTEAFKSWVLNDRGNNLNAAKQSGTYSPAANNQTRCTVPDFTSDPENKLTDAQRSKNIDHMAAIRAKMKGTKYGPPS